MKNFDDHGSVPYTTKTGLKIGLLYQKPPTIQSREDEFIQGILLGDRPNPDMYEILEWVVCFTLLYVLIAVVMTWGAS